MRVGVRQSPTELRSVSPVQPAKLTSQPTASFRKPLKKVHIERRKAFAISRVGSPATSQQREKRLRVSIVEKEAAKVAVRIRPNDTTHKRWEYVMLAFDLYLSVALPFGAAFVSSWGGSIPLSALVMDGCAVAILVADIIVSLNTGFFSDFQVVEAKKSIVRKRYMRSWGPVDIAAALPVELIWAAITSVYPAPNRTLVYSILRLSHLIRLSHWLAPASDLGTRKHSHFYRIGTLLGSVLLLVHWVACVWWTLLEEEPANTTAPIQTAYTVALYHATLNLFGEDIAPTTVGGRILATVTMLGGAGITAVVTANFAHLVSMRNHIMSRHNEQLELVSRTMLMLKLPHAMQRRVVSYYDYVWSTHRDFLGHAFLQQLPVTLQTEVSSYVHAQVLREVHALKGCSNGFVSSLSRKLRPIVFMAGTAVFEEGTIGRCMFFIMKGTIAIHLKNGALLNVLNAGDFFGEVAVLASTRRAAGARALSICDCFELDKDSFDEVAGMFPLDEERIKQAALVNMYDLAKTKPTTSQATPETSDGQHAASAHKAHRDSLRMYGGKGTAYAGGRGSVVAAAPAGGPPAAAAPAAKPPPRGRSAGTKRLSTPQCTAALFRKAAQGVRMAVRIKNLQEAGKCSSTEAAMDEASRRSAEEMSTHANQGKAPVTSEAEWAAQQAQRAQGGESQRHETTAAGVHSVQEQQEARLEKMEVGMQALLSGHAELKELILSKSPSPTGRHQRMDDGIAEAPDEMTVVPMSDLEAEGGSSS